MTQEIAKNPPSPKPDSNLDSSQDDSLRMPLWQHLDELRSGIIRALVVTILLTMVIFNFIEPVILFLEKPLLDVLPPGEQQLYFTGIADKFMIYIKVSVLAAFGLASPYLLFEVWRFVSPALYQRERSFALPFLFLGTLSFWAGLVFAYYVVVPFSYDFLINFGSETDKAIITLTAYFSMTIKLILGMGLLFELPVCLVLLAFAGLLEAQTLIDYRKYAVLAICIIAAVVTPSPDALTMLVVMGPLYLLYEISILGVRWVGRRSKTATDEND